MKTLKKLGLLMFVFVMMLSFSACGGSDKDVPGTTAEKTEVELYVEENGEELIADFESGLKSSGLTCESTVEGKGNEIILTTNIDQLDNLTDDQKEQMQDMFDDMNSEMKAGFSGVEKELPTLERISFNICEKDGDEVADIVIDF